MSGHTGSRKKEEDIVFKSLLEVWKYLKAEGWHISKSGLYKHREKGLIKAGDGGYYHLKGVRRYIRLAGLRKSPLTTAKLYDPTSSRQRRDYGETGPTAPKEDEAAGAGANGQAAKAEEATRQRHQADELALPDIQDIEILQAKKLQAETRIQQLREEKLRLELEREKGRWIRREDMEREIVARAIAMDAFIRQRVLVKAPELILAVSGDSSRAREFLAVFEEIWEEALNDFARQDRFKVLNIEAKEEKKDGKEERAAS